jgi:hypothetical protein
MTRIEPKIVVAPVSVFVALAGFSVAIHGLIVGRPSVVRFGAASTVPVVAALIVITNPPPHEW